MTIRDHKLAVRAPFGTFSAEPMRVNADGMMLYTYPGGRLLTLPEIAAEGCTWKRVTPGFDVYGGRSVGSGWG